MLGQTNEHIFGTNVLECLAECPAILVHEQGDEQDQTPVVAVGREDETAHSVVFCLLDEGLELAKFFQLLIPQLVRFVLDQFEFEVFDVGVVEVVRGLCRTVDHVDQLIGLEECLVLRGG